MLYLLVYSVKKTSNSEQGGSAYVRCIKLILSSVVVMATLLAMSAAPSMANDWDDGCVEVVQGGERIGVGSVDNDRNDCRWHDCDRDHFDWDDECN
jgi:hypothetical protein